MELVTSYFVIYTFDTIISVAIRKYYEKQTNQYTEVIKGGWVCLHSRVILEIV